MENTGRRALSDDLDRSPVAPAPQGKKPAGRPRTHRRLDFSVWPWARVCHHAWPRSEDRRIARIPAASRQRPALDLRETRGRRQSRGRLFGQRNPMSRPTQTAVERRKWLARLLPDGIPALWCPLITHYDRDGAIDPSRVTAHLRHLSPHVKGYLIPGSTGDGWELSDAETRRLLEVVVEQVTQLNPHLLIGAFNTEAGAALQAIRDTTDWIQARTKGGLLENSLAQSGVCGFTIGPPRGKELSQQQMSSALRAILETQVPVAIYQLPQVTQNEMSPELVADLARQFPNFILFKDTSGADRVALSGQKLENIFLVRGAEGDYVRWLKIVKGPYDGFLLSSANCFARQLHEIIEDLKTRRAKAAQ